MRTTRWFVAALGLFALVGGCWVTAAEVRDKIAEIDSAADTGTDPDE